MSLRDLTTPRTPRRVFLKKLGLAGGGFAALPIVPSRLRNSSWPQTESGPSPLITQEAYPFSGVFPQQPAAEVQAVVGASHRDLARVQELISRRPELANATWDWGLGDWESALGAASHTGRREIAEYLLGMGARPTLFSAAMLGRVDTVRAHLSADPGARLRPGPHGISLLSHARAGGQQATVVVDLIESLGGDAGMPVTFEPDEAEAARMRGTYRYGPQPEEIITVELSRTFLMFGFGAEANFRIRRDGSGRLHPAASPSITLAFGQEDPASTLSIASPSIDLTGSRMD